MLQPHFIPSQRTECRGLAGNWHLENLPDRDLEGSADVPFAFRSPGNLPATPIILWGFFLRSWMYFKDERVNCLGKSATARIGYLKFQWISAAFAEGGKHPSIQHLFPANSTFILVLFHISKSSFLSLPFSFH